MFCLINKYVVVVMVEMKLMVMMLQSDIVAWLVGRLVGCVRG
jgi:hypothetical protein